MTKGDAPKFYQHRLMNVLISKDIAQLMDKHFPESNMDLIDSRYWLLDNWALVKDDVLLMIKEVVNND